MADEQIIKDEEDLALLLAKQQEIQNEIANAIREGRDQIRIDFGHSTVIYIKPVKLLDDNIDSNEYRDRYSFSSEDKSITGKVSRDKTGKIKVDVDFDKKRIDQRLDEERRKERKLDRSIKKHTVDKNDQNALKREIEVGLKNGDVTELDIDREFSESENMRMFARRAWGVSSKQIYRVKGKDSHEFKYVVKTTSGKFEQLDLSHSREGTNSRQKIWVMKDGVLQEKTVDSLLIKGRYAIATDRPESVSSQNTTTYLVTRTPSGRYIAIAAGERRGVNRNTSGDKNQKYYSARGRSVYELEHVLDAAETASQVNAFNKDGKLTTKEVEIVRRVEKDKGVDEEEFFDAVTILIFELKDMGFECNQIKKILDTRDKDDILKLATEVDDHSNESIGNSKKKKLVDEDIEGNDEEGDSEFSRFNNPHNHSHEHRH